MAKRHMLTTIDNPFNPWDDWDSWNNWDEQAGYYTNAFLARVVRTSHDLSDADQDKALEDAIEEIVHENVLGLYKRIEVPDAVVDAA